MKQYYHTDSSAPPDRDPQLWAIAQKRASFKYHLAVYVVINIFFWVLWYFSGARIEERANWPWPVWPMFGWGIGLVFHYLGAYVFPRDNSVEREYDKLKQKQNR
jgi:hypothetical protein